MPDLAVYPNTLFVPRPPVPHPGPPPSDKRGNPHARIICEVAMAQRSSDLKEKCRLWKHQPYVRAVLGIKLYETKTTRNARGYRDRAMKWKFGTVNKDGSATSCNALGNPNYLINIPVRDVFYNPPVPAVAYGPLPPPPAVLMGTNITIDLYEVQQAVLLYQEM
ncbi:10334_t:CDS:2 [Acaulospora colombiana]|uniref:10334_t:CDS:1 n=1 Tax=Acaulospora colombiana TaxID=27376 RepID=A0ACA9M4P5_9GLOM|nr:10334_t:CDS:2 [Acaulospora colombiana]